MLCKVDTANDINAIQFHPDGQLFSTGHLNGKITLWDINSQKNELNFEPKNKLFNIKDLKFSNNGYNIITLNEEDDSSSVKVWDIRKGQAVKEFNVSDKANKISVDYNGNYFSLAGQGTNLSLFSLVKNEISENLISLNDEESSNYTNLLFDIESKNVIATTKTGKLSLFV